MTRKPKLKLKRTPRDVIMDSALAIAARTEWRDITMEAIAAEARVSLAEALLEFPNKDRLVAGFIDRVDASVVATSSRIVQEDTARDRLFDIMMRRFDALRPVKPVLHNLMPSLCDKPLDVVFQLMRIQSSMHLMLEAAEIDSTGFQGALKVKGLSLIYGNALRVWLNDESSDLSATMAALDRGLMQAERLLRLVKPAEYMNGNNL